MRRRRSTRGSPTAPVCTRCCRRSPTVVRSLSLRRVRSSSHDVGGPRGSGMRSPDLAPVLRGLGAVQVVPHRVRRDRLRQDDLAGVAAWPKSIRGNGSCSSRRRARCGPSHPHVVRLVERAANVDGAGAVGMSRLVREALRMRPDRIVLGECRGAEIRDVLLALNTGHRGSLTTLHANAAADVPARLAGLGALAGLSERAVALHASAAFAAVVHLVRDATRRRVAEVALLQSRAGELTAVPAARSTQTGGSITVQRGPRCGRPRSLKATRSRWP